KPNKALGKIYIIRSKATTSVIGVIINVVIVEIATIIIICELINPAETDTSPKIRAPTILTACPIARGIRTPASRTISNKISKVIITKNNGNGKHYRDYSSATRNWEEIIYL